MQRINKFVDHLRPKNLYPMAAYEKKGPWKVCVTGAAGNIAYAIIFAIGRGQLLGQNRPIEIRLLDIPPMQAALNGVVMELEDCAFPLITKIVGTTDYRTAFEDVDVALLIGARPRGPGMVRADLLKANAGIFAGQGKAIDEFASKNVKVCVVGNPANTNALICMKNAPSIPKKNFSAMTRLDQNRAIAQVANRLGCSISKIKNVVIWGNHSKTQYPDVSHATVDGHSANGPVRTVVSDDVWLDGEFITTIQQRGAAIIAARKLSSAASAANACMDHVRDWICGTKEGQIVSMAVVSDGSYGVPEDIIYSFPVTCANGEYSIVQGLPIDKNSRKLMDATAQELVEERTTALAL
eukprot:79827_1